MHLQYEAYYDDMYFHRPLVRFGKTWVIGYHPIGLFSKYSYEESRIDVSEKGWLKVPLTVIDYEKGARW